ncbi:MAG TPA: GNAT family N-acetyltransferase [Longimicrobium sp.]|nr:GNAT family N-acetyltransferase [Longimicrobium sp.]
MLAADEAAVLDRVAPDVFDHAVDPRWCAEFFADPRHHLAVAMDGAEVVGFASGVHYVHPDKPPELFVNEVGVAATHQGWGLACRLMRTLLDHGRSLGCVQAWVGTDRDNAAANRLYASAGGVPEAFVLYAFDLADGG